MEVATVGRSLGTLVGGALHDRNLLGRLDPFEIGMIVAAAALAHDIGNPPFGHSGEDAIRSWFVTSKVSARIRNGFSKEEVADFENYEGNAQGFRILTRLQMYKDQGGMRLTAATLAAFTKYPVQASTDAPNKPRVHKGKSTEKFGFFQAERPIFEAVARMTGLLQRAEDAFCWARHPLAFLVEAADDICYRIVDLEDAFRQKLVSYQEVKARVEPFLKPESFKRIEQERDESSRVDVIRSFVMRDAINYVADAFLQRERHSEILRGEFDREIITLTPLRESFASIKELQRERVYLNERVLRVEATGFRVIGGLLDAFVTAVEDYHAFHGKTKVPAESEKLFYLIPKQFLGPDGVPADSPYLRLLGVVDYVCGMTDSYALNLFRNISGISLP